MGVDVCVAGMCLYVRSGANIAGTKGGGGVRLCGSAAHDQLSHYTHTYTQLPNQPGRRASLTFPSVSGFPHSLI